MTAVEILKKHGVKPTKTQKANAKIEEVIKAHKGVCAKEKIVRDRKVAEDRVVDKAVAAHEIKAPKEGSRASLMAQAKEKGIKYFRILTKAQLQIVLAEGVHPDKIKVIQEEAVYKWKNGWTKKAINA